MILHLILKILKIQLVIVFQKQKNRPKDLYDMEIKQHHNNVHLKCKLSENISMHNKQFLNKFNQQNI